MMKSDEELSDDVLKDFKNDVQKIIDHHNDIIDRKVKIKEEELMKL